MLTATAISSPESGKAPRRVSSQKESVPSEAFVRAMQCYVRSNRLEEGQKFLDLLNQNLAVEDGWPMIARRLQAILSEAWERRNTGLAGARDVTHTSFFFGDGARYVENQKTDDTLCPVG